MCDLVRLRMCLLDSMHNESYVSMHTTYGDQAHNIMIRLHQLCGWVLSDAKRVPQGFATLSKVGKVLGLDTFVQGAKLLDA